ncbi:MAG: hypothetical protein EPO16_05730 [Dehalococcoidia bacterium]|nr:MAG: hypothetical protein EPO16_05730 [Dehalococcoidia bacterium]
MLKVAFSMALAMALLVVVMVPQPQPSNVAEATIHEIVAANCSVGEGNQLAPPGQSTPGQSFVRALQATGVIESIDTTAGDGNDTQVNFDLDRPASKYMSAGFDLVIPNFFGAGMDLILSPLAIPRDDFPAFVHCANLNP